MNPLGRPYRVVLARLRPFTPTVIELLPVAEASEFVASLFPADEPELEAVGGMPMR